MANHETVPGSASTRGTAERRNSATSFSFPGLACSGTYSAYLVIGISSLTARRQRIRETRVEAGKGLDGVHAQMKASAARSPWRAPGRANTAQREERHMSKVTYEIVEHDGGWAYRVGDV